MTPEQREKLKQAADRIIDDGWYEERDKGMALDACASDYDFIFKANPAAILSLIDQVEALTVPQVYQMSTAPHDGTEVLAWSKTGKTWHQVYWKTQENGDWLFLPPFPPRWACRWNDAYYQGQAEFSHWTPIPAAPTIPAIPGTKEGAIDVHDFMPPHVSEAVKAGTNMEDLTPYFQAAIDSQPDSKQIALGSLRQLANKVQSAGFPDIARAIMIDISVLEN